MVPTLGQISGGANSYVSAAIAPVGDSTATLDGQRKGACALFKSNDLRYAGGRLWPDPSR